MKCKVTTCKNQIESGIGMLCAGCYKTLKAKRMAELSETGLKLLDHHGAEFKTEGPIESRTTEMDTPAEFQNIVISQKLDFAGRCIAEKCQDLNALKSTVFDMQNHLRNSFIDWLGKKIPLSKEDPLILQVSVQTFNGKTVAEAFNRFTFEDNYGPENQMAKLNSELFELPNLMEKIASALSRRRHVYVYLKWWGTLQEFDNKGFIQHMTLRGLQQGADGRIVKPTPSVH